MIHNGAKHKRTQQHPKKRRIDAKGPARPESDQIDATLANILLEDQTRNQKAAQNEEEVDSGPSGFRPKPGDRLMTAQNQQNRYAPQSIQTREPRSGGWMYMTRKGTVTAHFDL